jgi:hypothetical protein
MLECCIRGAAAASLASSNKIRKVAERKIKAEHEGKYK